MKNAIAHIKSDALYSQSKYYTTPKLNDKESSADYEKRTWRDRLHVDADGYVFIPPMSFKNCLSEAAKFLSMQVQGKGKATYTKHFEAGVLCVEPIPLGIHKDEVIGDTVFVPADGVRGSGKRVEKTFPIIQKWEAKVKFLILDDTITKDIFEYHLKQSGRFIGIGRFRPRNNGHYGRFTVEKIEWEDIDDRL